MTSNINNSNQKTAKIIGVFVISTIIIIGVYFLIINNQPEKSNKQESVATNQSSINTTEVSENKPDAKVVVKYKDGTYEATESYTVPKGFTNDINVKLTVQDGKVVAVVTSHATQERESDIYVADFDKQITSAVVGKTLDETLIDKLSGASLTSTGFNQAIEQIKTQAKT
jgi:uncharacterized protein with FMN-binding domain